MARATKAVAKTEEPEVPAVAGYDEYDGAGFENQTREDYAIPFVAVLQSNSPQVETLDGAKAGMIVNTVTNDLYPGNEGIVFIPALTDHVYVEWRPREQGGGFVGIHAIDSDVVQQCKSEQEFGKYKTNGNDLVETFYVYGIMVKPDGSSEQVVIAFASTKIKKYKQFMTKARAIQVTLPNGRRITPPLFAHRYRLTTVKESNKHGQFYNWMVAFDGEDATEARLPTDNEYFQQAAGIRGLVKEGAARAAYDSQGADRGTAPGEDDGEAPF